MKKSFAKEDAINNLLLQLGVREMFELYSG